jgi:hypothetical protein
LALLEARAHLYAHAHSAQAAKKGVRKEKGVEAEPKVKAEPSSKRPQPTSSEVSTLKLFAATRQRARELGEGLLEEEGLENLVPFEEMLKD